MEPSEITWAEKAALIAGCVPIVLIGLLYLLV
jgi:hypothetical protein